MPAWLTSVRHSVLRRSDFWDCTGWQDAPTAGCLHLLASVPVVAMLLRCVFCVCFVCVLRAFRVADQQILFRLSSLGYVCIHLLMKTGTQDGK